MPAPLAIPALSTVLPVPEFRVPRRQTTSEAPRTHPTGRDATPSLADDPSHASAPNARAGASEPEAEHVEPPGAETSPAHDQQDLSDHAIVDAARSGDRAAFALLHDRYAPMIHGILLSHASPADADDLVQEVFLRAMRSIGTLRDAPAVGGWLVAIARNTAISRRRAARPTAPLVEAPDPREHAASASLSAHEALDTIHELPDAYRETLVLRLVEGLSGPQIAERLGMSEGSVRVNLCRGMKMLRQRLGWEGEP